MFCFRTKLVDFVPHERRCIGSEENRFRVERRMHVLSQQLLERRVILSIYWRPRTLARGIIRTSEEGAVLAMPELHRAETFGTANADLVQMWRYGFVVETL